MKENRKPRGDLRYLVVGTRMKREENKCMNVYETSWLPLRLLPPILGETGKK